jgi:15-cis-phytoene synthase
MPDAFAYCAELVRTADRDRYLAALFAPAERRRGLHALYAFNSEVARVREAAREPLPGEIRLQWWSEVLRGDRSAEASANPVAAALLATIADHELAPMRLIGLIEARRFDLYEEPMLSLTDLKDHARKTASVLFSLGAQILCGFDLPAVAEPAGIAWAIVALLRAFPLHAAHRQIYLPLDVLERHQVHTRDIYACRSSSGLKAAFAELRELAGRHLDSVRLHMRVLPSDALPAFLVLALTRPLLDRLLRSDPFAPADLAPWRRQWLIWRAARNPARIAG